MTLLKNKLLFLFEIYIFWTSQCQVSIHHRINRAVSRLGARCVTVTGKKKKTKKVRDERTHADTQRTQPHAYGSGKEKKKTIKKTG